METSEIAYGRIGLLGNPSDMYGGKGISLTFDNYAAALISDADEFSISGNGNLVDRSLYDFSENGLVKAAIHELGMQEAAKKFSIVYETHVPVGSGLAGSSAIIIATMKALNKHLGLGLNRYQIAEAAMHAELDRLGIAAGPQDRYIISVGGIAHMDFRGKEYLRKTDNTGIVTPLGIKKMPFFLCLGMKPKSSALVHNNLRAEFLKGGEGAKEIKEKMDKIAELADEGFQPLLHGDWESVGRLMNENCRLRDELYPPFPADREMVQKALEYGAYGAKLAGSGRGVVVLGDDSVLEKMVRHYPCLKPEIARYEDTPR